MKFATPIGALSGKSVQFILPALVSMMAAGVAPAIEAEAAGLAVVAGLACDAGLAELVWAAADDPAISNAPRAANVLRISAP
jgi:hypothetical protein